MTSPNNESMNTSSLSALFKTPKPSVKPYRRKQTASSPSSSKPAPSGTVLAARTANDQKPRTIPNSVNFSGDIDSMDESVPTVKKRRTSQPKKSLKISFSRSTAGSTEDSLTELKTGYLRRLRESAKPAKVANFSTQLSIEGSARGASSSTLRSADNVWTDVHLLSISPSWTSNEEPRMRRCSTPQRGTYRPRMPPTNLSLIPRALSFEGSSATPFHSSENGYQSAQSSSSNSTPSLVTKAFRGPPSIDLDKENVPVVERATRGRKVDPDFKRRSVFPRLAPYCNKRYYEYFIYKMEPKYGIRTKSRVVKVSEKVHALVQNIVSRKNNYHQLVRRLQNLLCRRNIIRTPYDFYWFALKFLPRDAVVKIVPIIQPFGSPLVADFDPQTTFEPIRLD